MTSERKAFYIDGHRAARVMRDGPALRVRMLQRADLLIPFHRLCRVVVMGPVVWSSQALRGCIDASIPVSFLSRNGRLQETLLSPMTATCVFGIASALETCCETFDSAADGHRLWIDLVGRQAQLRYAYESGLTFYSASVALLTAITDYRDRHYARVPHLKQFDQRILGLLKAHLLYLFHRDAFPLPWLPVLEKLRIDLVNDYASVLFWSLQQPKQRFLKRAYRRARRRGCVKAEIPLKAAPDFYESQSALNERHFVKLLRQHYSQLREALGCRVDY
ncbi:MAG: hypothetical protein F4101_07050 [Nitrospira sp. SB0673_bin_12]|nr:hypothetical protein [Nitrospira sp. SB0673_bin_12]